MFKNSILKGIVFIVLCIAVIFASCDSDTSTTTCTHEWSGWESVTAATCVAQGSEKRVCSLCEKTETRNTAINPNAHDFGASYTVDAPATCTIKGTASGTCIRSGCGKTTTMDINPLGHLFEDYASNDDAVCGVDGTKTAVCERPGCDEEDTITDEGTALEHIFETYVSNNDAVCGVNGTKTAICERVSCAEEDTITDEGTALSHTLGMIQTIAPTLIKRGLETRGCTREGCGYFTETTRPVLSIPITANSGWNQALEMIKNAPNNDEYWLNISGDITIYGSTDYSFGDKTNITVTLTGSGKLSLNSKGYLLYVNNNQTLIIESVGIEYIVLEGYEENDKPLIYVNGNNAELQLKSGVKIIGNKNKAVNSRGGGVEIYGGSFIMTGSEICDNSAVSGGGGVYVHSTGLTGGTGSFTMTDGVIYGNTVTDTTAARGGGVFIIDADFEKSSYANIMGGGVGSDYNNARATFGHAVFFQKGSSENYYRDTSHGYSDGTMSTNSLPANSGESLGGWTKR